MLLLAGFGLGLLTGFLGVGGGFLIVPALTLLGGLPIHVAVGTSLLVIAANSRERTHRPPARRRPAARPDGGLHRGGCRPGRSQACGSPRGLDAERLRRAFAFFVIAVGLVLLAKNA